MKKKLFISCPMKGRTEENIKNSMEKMHELAEMVFGEELEVIPTYIKDAAPECKNRSIWYLGESIKLLSEADYFIGIDYVECFPGCNIERQVAREYNIPDYHLYVHAPAFFADCVDIMKEYYKEKEKCLLEN